MQCRELFQEMAIDIIPPYMIAAKVGPLGYPGHHPMTVDPRTQQITEIGATGPTDSGAAGPLEVQFLDFQSKHQRFGQAEGCGPGHTASW